MSWWYSAQNFVLLVDVIIVQGALLKTLPEMLENVDCFVTDDFSFTLPYLFDF